MRKVIKQCRILPILLLVLAFFGCEKEDDSLFLPDPGLTTPELTDTSELPFHWSQAHPQKNLPCTGIEPVSYGDKFISILSNCAKGPLVQAYKKQTGEVVWRWNDFIYPGSTVLRGRLLPDSEPHMLIINNYHALYAIDMNSGATIWKMSAPEEIYGIDHGIILFGNHIYINNTTTVGGDDDGYVFRLNIKCSDPEWEEVLLFEGKDDWNPMISGRLNSWINSSGDSLLLVYRDLYRFPNETKAELAAYNLTTTQMEFSDTTLVSPEYSVSELIEVYENLLIYVSSRSAIQAYNLETHQVEWTYSADHSLQQAGFKIHENTLYIKDSEEFKAIDPRTGTEQFVIPEPSESREAKLSFYEDLVFYSGEKFVVVDIAQKDTLLTDITLASYEGEPIHNGVAVSEQTSQIFITDLQYAMCIKIEDL